MYSCKQGKMVKSVLIILLCFCSWTNAITHDEVEIFIKSMIKKDEAKYYSDSSDIERIRSLLFGMINTCPTLPLQVVIHEWLKLDECTSDFQTFMANLAIEPPIFINMDKVETQISGLSYCLVNTITTVVEECFISDNSTDHKKELNLIRSFSLYAMAFLNDLLTNWVTIAYKDELYLLEILRLVKIMPVVDVMAFQTCTVRLARAHALGHNVLSQEEELGPFPQCLLAGLEYSDYGFCGFFEPDIITYFKKCLGSDYKFCDSGGFTNMLSIILGHKEFLQILNKIFCSTSENYITPNMDIGFFNKEE